MGVALRRYAASEADHDRPVVIDKYIGMLAVAAICGELSVLDDEHVCVPGIRDAHPSISADDVVAAFKDVLALGDDLDLDVLAPLVLILPESFHEPLDVALLALHDLIPFVCAALAAHSDS